MTVEKIGSWIPVTDESIVDFALGTPEEQAAAAARIQARRAASAAMWRALPFRVRVYRAHIRPVVAEVRRRMAHAAAALRGEECEQ